MPLLFCLLAAAFICLLSISLYGASQWIDAVRYMSTGKSIVLEGRFMPALLDYRDFITHGAAAYGEQAYRYPSPAFTISIGLLGLLRGDFSLINSLWVTFAFSVAAACVLYFMSFALMRERLVSVIFVLLVFLHREMIFHTGLPLTDMGMFFFVCASAFAYVRGKVRIGALIFAFGYMFREVSILFLPLLPLLDPETVTVRAYFKNCLLCLAVFIPFFVLARLTNTLLSYGASEPDFYMNFGRHLLTSASSQHFINFLSNILVFLKRTAGIPLLACLLLWGKMTGQGKRLLAVSLVYGLLACLLSSYSKGVPERYFLPVIPLLTLAVLTAVQSFDGKKRCLAIAFCIVLLVIAGRVHRSPLLFHEAWDGGKTPAKTAELAQAPMLAAEFFPPGAVILSHGQGPYAVPDAIHVRLPSVEEFMTADNNGVAGILLMTPRDDWKSMLPVDFFRDSYGTTFEKIDMAPLPVGHAYFKRKN